MVMMEDKRYPLVSIVSACYNGERYIRDFLDSVLSQSYRNIELICIDDGSTDFTVKILYSYQERFEKRGIQFLIKQQTNQGQAAATNAGLKLIHGKYLCWVDCDDYLSKDSIEKRVAYMEKYPDVGVVTSDFYLRYEDEKDEGTETRAGLYGTLNWQSNQFYLALTGESIIENLAQMIRVEDFRKINPDLEISVCREGQNYQIMLPMLYYYKRGFIDEPLATYRIHGDSHYHKARSHTELIRRFEILLEMLQEILESLNLTQEQILHYIKISTFYMEKKRFLEYGRNL